MSLSSSASSILGESSIGVRISVPVSLATLGRPGKDFLETLCLRFRRGLARQRGQVRHPRAKGLDHQRGATMDRFARLAMMEFTPPVETIEPARLASPLVLSSPHSGSIYPQRLLGVSRLDPLTCIRAEDAYVDELFRPCVKLGAPLLRALFPRAYLDVNREPYELAPPA